MRYLELVTRRTFLSGVTVWGGAGALLKTWFSAGRSSLPGPNHSASSAVGVTADPGTPSFRPDRDSAATFEQYLHTPFRIIPQDGGTPNVVYLTKVTRSQTIAQPGRGAPEPTPRFSLIFRGPSTPVAQDTYRVEHSRLGAFSLFLVPVGPGRGESCYQAIFA